MPCVAKKSAESCWNERPVNDGNCAGDSYSLGRIFRCAAGLEAERHIHKDFECGARSRVVGHVEKDRLAFMDNARLVIQ